MATSEVSGLDELLVNKLWLPLKIFRDFFQNAMQTWPLCYVIFLFDNCCASTLPHLVCGLPALNNSLALLRRNTNNAIAPSLIK